MKLKTRLKYLLLALTVIAFFYWFLVRRMGIVF